MATAGEETMSIVRDEDCPACGWPETYASGTIAQGPTTLGCRQCGWTAPVRREGDG